MKKSLVKIKIKGSVPKFSLRGKPKDLIYDLAIALTSNKKFKLILKHAFTLSDLLEAKTNAKLNSTVERHIDNQIISSIQDFAKDLDAQYIKKS